MVELFENERIGIPEPNDTSSGTMTDEQINAKYIKGDIRIVTEQARYPLTAISGMLKSGDYEINPEFQRRHRWDKAKQSRLIESFIMNVPVPPIFLYEDRFSHYEVMDGLQRLTAINDLYEDKFVLVGLVEWSELNDKSYSKLPEQVRRGIDRRYISSIILLQETAKDATEAQVLKQLVFERINSGGVKLEPQESRNAIYPGPLNSLCIRLSRNTFLCRSWAIPEPDTAELKGGTISGTLLANELYRKMDDVELVLRFFAYRQRLTNQKGALKDYLDGYLCVGNRYPRELLGRLERLFSDTIELVYNIFGETSFWLYRKRNDRWAWYQRPTTVIYDPLMFVVSQRLDRSGELILKSEQIRAGLPEFYKHHYDMLEGRYTNLANTRARNEAFSQYIGSFLD